MSFLTVFFLDVGLSSSFFSHGYTLTPWPGTLRFERNIYHVQMYFPTWISSSTSVYPRAMDGRDLSHEQPATPVGISFHTSSRRVIFFVPLWWFRNTTNGKKPYKTNQPYMPIPSMYGVFTYIWLIFMVNVGKYTMHGFYGFVWKGSHVPFSVIEKP